MAAEFHLSNTIIVVDFCSNRVGRAVDYFVDSKFSICEISYCKSCEIVTNGMIS
jgi:hypothetical protein